MSNTNDSFNEKWVNDNLSNTAVTALVLILRKHKLPRGYGIRPEIHKKIVQYIQEGKLDVEDLLDEIRLIQECSSKIIYLREIVNKSLLKNTQRLNEILTGKLPRQRSENKKTLFLPATPTVNYYEITDSEVRIKFSETHKNIKPNISARTYEEIKHTNVIVFSISRKVGSATIYLDTPWVEHPHPNDYGKFTKDSYFKHYFDRFFDLFGENISLNLTSNINNLIHSENPVCFPKVDSGINDSNNKRTLSGEDLSNDDEYKSLKRDRIIEFTNLNFLADKSQEKLLDNINIVVHPIEGRINIQAERLSSEVDYVISAITKI